MPKRIHRSPIVLSYAAALLELAEERKELELIGRELAALQELIQAVPSFRLYLSDPGVSSGDRQHLLTTTLGNQASQLMMSFLRVLNQKHRLGLLDEIADAYDELLDEKHGKIEVDVTVATKLSADELEEVRRRVGAVLKRDAVIHQYVDEKIIGGMVLRVQDQLIDSSVRAQLEAMRRKLHAAAPE